MYIREHNFLILKEGGESILWSPLKFHLASKYYDLYRKMIKENNWKRNVRREKKLRRLQKRPSVKSWLLRERHLLLSPRNLPRKPV